MHIVYCSRTHKFHFSATFFIKNGSHDTIYTFKNYFAIVFFSFQFQFLVFNCIQTDPKMDASHIFKIPLYPKKVTLSPLPSLSFFNLSNHPRTFKVLFRLKNKPFFLNIIFSFFLNIYFFWEKCKIDPLNFFNFYFSPLTLLLFISVF